MDNAPVGMGPMSSEADAHSLLYRRLLALSRAAVRVQQAPTPEAVLATVGEELTAAGLEWHYAAFDAIADTLTLRAASLAPAILGAAERLLGVRAIGFVLPIDRVALLREAVRAGRASYSDGVTALAETFPRLPAALARRLAVLIGASGFITAPLLVRDQPLGTLTVWSDNLTPDDLPAVVIFAQQAAAALENARQFQEARAAERRQAFLAEASTTLASSLDYATTIQRAAHLAVPAIADLCVVDLRDATGVLRRVAVAHRVPTREAELQALAANYPAGWEARHPVGQVLADGRPLLVNEPSLDLVDDLRRDDGPEHLAISRATGVHAYVIVPLRLRGAVLGALAFVRTAAGERAPYRAEDLALAEELAGRVATAIDHARLYAAERAARADAELAVREREDFLSVAAHELKTPVTSLRGFTQLLLRRLERRHEVDFVPTQRMLEQINRQSGKLTQLVEQLLDVSRIEAGRLRLALTEVDLSWLVRETIEAVRAQAENRPILAMIQAGVQATVDAVRIEQTFVNLLDNAIRYSPEEVAIDVTLEQTAEAVRLTVRDRGPGVPAEQRSTLFERFSRTTGDRQMQGLGLGLFLSRQIAEQHGGWLDAEFPPDGGARFVLTLPVAPR